jgi:hypothetical protein
MLATTTLAASVDPTDARSSNTGFRDRYREGQKVPKNAAISLHQSSLAPSCIHEGIQMYGDLARIVDAWPRLPESVRASIMLLVKAAAGK